MNLTHAQRMLAHAETEERRRVIAGRMSTPEGIQSIVDEIDAARADKLRKSGAGKVFHTKAHKRMKNEKYYTPAWATRCLLRQVKFAGSVWEPSAGDGKIMDALSVAGYTVTGTDLVPDRGDILQVNFLATKLAHDWMIPRSSIVTNPPFGTGGRLAFQFCWHALRLTERHRGKVAMLMRDDFDSAGGRSELFDHPAWDKKIVMRTRIRWTNLPQKAKAGPSGNHAWYVWDWARAAGPATLHYERSDEE